MADSKFTPAILMALLSIIVLGIILTGLKIVLPRTSLDKKQQDGIFSKSVIVILLWVILLSVFSYRDFFSDFSRFPPRVLLAVLTPLPVVLFIAFSRKGTKILQSTPPQWLIFMQAFRIFVELLLWLAFLRNLIPSQMTFEGRNFDVLSGLLALAAGWYCFIKKKWAVEVAVIYNIVGILLLLNILIVAILSTPSPVRYFMNEPANTIVAEFPFIFLPGILVPVAYGLHILSLRQLAVGSEV